MKNWKIRLKAAGIRVIKTVAQTAVASTAVLAGALSLLTSVAGLPEVDSAVGNTSGAAK